MGSTDLKAGDLVRVLSPFDEFYPGIWEVTGLNAETGAVQINDGVDFDPIYLELME
jgi:hypothetical protein